jgi:hypothetical protein
MKRRWNKFLNWLIPGRKERLLIRMIRDAEELGLYDESKCCGHWNEMGECSCKKVAK